MLRPQYPIVTPRLALRPITVGDAAAMAEYQSREDVCRYLPYSPRSLEVLQDRLANPHNVRSTLEEENEAMFLAVVRRDDGRLVGDLMLRWISREHGTGEIGYVFDPRFAGNGYATEAAFELLRLAFADLGLHRIIARLDVRNGPSARLLQRLGMRQEAHLLESEWFKGEWTDELDYAILQREWRAQQPTE